jgi:hypothetical protein
MKKMRAYFLFLLPFLLLSPIPLSTGADVTVNEAFGPIRNERNLSIVDGFAALKWGVSVEDAHKIYPDLREDSSKFYTQYYKGKKGPDGVYVFYVRNNENLRVGGHSLEPIEYRFLQGKFVAVGMGVSCDEDTPCNTEAIYQDIVKAIRKIYGKPYNLASRTYQDDATVSKTGGIEKVQEIEWKIEDETITVSKSVEPKFSSIDIFIFSYQGYFSATGQER